jgi:hypothetical protein
VITVGYFETCVPLDADALALTMDSSSPPPAAELRSWRHIIAAAFSLVPQDAAVRAAVERLVWYAPVAGRTEADLDGEQRALLAWLDAFIAKRSAAEAAEHAAGAAESATDTGTSAPR